MKPTKHKASGLWCIRIPPRLSDTARWQIKYFSSEAKARESVKVIQTEKTEHGRQAVTAEERHWINVVRNELGSVDKLRQVLDHWHKTGAGVVPISAREATAEFLEWRKADKLNMGTKQDISWRLNAFAEQFGDRPMFQITAGDLERWLRNYSEGWSRRSIYKRIRPLFAHAKRHRWLMHNPMDDLVPPATPNPRREVYTPEQYQKLLTTAFEMEGDALWLYLILSGNAFFRVQELVRRFGNEPVLEWGDFLWDRELIHVRAEVAKSTKRKSGNERFVPIHQNIHEWLAQRRVPVRASGRVIDCSVRHFGELLRQLHAKAEVPFIKNGMRKSAISYYLARYPQIGIGQLALYAGNSEPSCRQHYLKILTEEDGRAWFAAPEKAFWQWFEKHQAPEVERLAAALEAEQEEQAYEQPQLASKPGEGTASAST